jgi:hypothetical protein
MNHDWTSGKKCYFEKPLEEFKNGELNICGDKQVGLFVISKRTCVCHVPAMAHFSKFS